jgi:ribosomal subunit interface protein
MDIIVKGRHTYVPEAFRTTATEKLSKIESHIPGATAIEVEISHENNPKLADQRLRVEITAFGTGPVVRAEAAASEALEAFDVAFGKLQERFRRTRDKAKHHRPAHGAPKEAVAFDPAALEAELKQEVKLAKASLDLDETPRELDDVSLLNEKLAVGETIEVRLDDSPVTIRKKVHNAEKLTIEEAIERMELVGHDFYAFTNDLNGRSSVVYRRHGWSYGVIELS